jgi:hypothetical protein
MTRSSSLERTTLTDDELRHRRGVLAQGLQGALLEGLAVDDDDREEIAALDEELTRRQLAATRAPSRPQSNS